MESRNIEEKKSYTNWMNIATVFFRHSTHKKITHTHTPTLKYNANKTHTEHTNLFILCLIFISQDETKREKKRK